MRLRARITGESAALWAALVCGCAWTSPASAVETSVASEFPKKLDLSYFLRFNGPEFGKSLGESFNFYLLDNWPLQFYHSLTLGWTLDRSQRLSAGLSGVQDLNEGVMSQYGYSIQPQFTFFNPTVSYARDSVIDNERLNVWMSLTASIPTSAFSQSLATITTLTLDQSWLIKQPVARLSAGLSGSVEYTIYGASESDSALASKRLWFLSIGHFASYRLSPLLGIATSSLFDFERQTRSADLLHSLGRDRLKVQLNIYPVAANLRIGVYSEGLLSSPHRTIYGMDLSAGI